MLAQFLSLSIFNCEVILFALSTSLPDSQYLTGLTTPMQVSIQLFPKHFLTQGVPPFQLLILPGLK